MEQAASFPHFNTRLGSQIIGPRYHFTAEGSLVEAARGLLEMGSDIIKLSLAGGYLTVAFKNTLAFLIIIIVLLIKPEGLLGEEFKERV